MSNTNVKVKDGYGVYTKLIIGDDTEENELIFGIDNISYLLIHEDYVNNEYPLMMVKLVVPIKKYLLLQNLVNKDKPYIEDININIYCTEDRYVNTEEEASNVDKDVKYYISNAYHNLIGFIDTIDNLSEEEKNVLDIDNEDVNKEQFVLRLGLFNKDDLQAYTKGITNGIYKSTNNDTIIYKSFLDTINKKLSLYMEKSHNTINYDYIQTFPTSFKQLLDYLDDEKGGIYKYKYKIFIKSNIMYLYPLIGNLNMKMDKSIRKNFRKNIEVTLLSKVKQTDIEEIYEEGKETLRIGYPFNKTNKNINYFPIYNKYINIDELTKLQISKEDSTYIINSYKTFSSSIKDANTSILHNKKLSLSISSLSPTIDFYPDNIINVIDEEYGGKYRLLENFQLFTKSGYQKSINLLRIE